MRNLVLSAVGPLFLVGLLCGEAFAEAAPEVSGRLVELPNPGAEKVDKDNPDMPADVGTFTTPGGSGTFSRDTSVARSGSASFHVVNHGPKGYSAAINFGVDAFPDMTYTVEGYIKTKDVQKAGFIVFGMGALRPRQTITGTNDWTKVTLQFTTPAGVESFAIYMIAYGASETGEGEAWFDDIEIRDNSREVIGGVFPPLRAELARLDEEARAAGMASKDLEHIAGALARAEKFEREISQITDASAVPPARWRAFFDAHKELDGVVVRFGREVATQKALFDTEVLTGEEKPVYITGFAPSTLHIFLEDRPFSMEVAERGRVLAVRGEREALQLVILPVERDLAGVSVTVGELVGAGGVIPATAVSVNPVGYVNIKSPLIAWYPQEPRYVGWWPDVVLPNFAFDVKKGKTQPVWIAVRVPRDAKAGKYLGQITVKPSDAPERKVGLEVEVADVDLPEQWHFRNLLCFDEGYGPMMYGDMEGWEAIRNKFNDFLLDRRINLGGLSGQTQARLSVDDMISYAKRGQNVIFVYQFAWSTKMQDAQGNPVTELPGKLHDWLPKLKEAGFYDRAIVYGWDEQPPERYPDMRIAAELLARDYPGIPLLMAGVDRSCGTDSILGGLPNIIFCSLMTAWDPEAVHKAKENGNEIWWYDTYWIIEQHLIRSRLIPWQSYKVGAEGFLIWAMNRWLGGQKLVSSESIRTSWDPRLSGGYQSSAMYVYPGENGPISSLRLENFCDGIEDYDLLVTARDLLATLEKRSDVDANVVENLRAAIALEDEFVKDALEYSTDPELLASHRRALIEALAAAHTYLP